MQGRGQPRAGDLQVVPRGRGDVRERGRVGAGVARHQQDQGWRDRQVPSQQLHREVGGDALVGHFL